MKLLAPLEGATRTLCGDSYPTSSMVIPTIRATINEIKKINVVAKESLLFKAVLVRNLKERFENAETDPVLSVATLLDPRFKTSGFSTIEQADTAKKTVVSAYKAMKASAQAQANRNVQTNSNQSTSKPDSSETNENRSGKRRREDEEEKVLKYRDLILRIYCKKISIHATR